LKKPKPSVDGAPKTTFADLGLKPEVLKAVTEMGFVEPMEVQRATIPMAREGHDILVQSRTGSGKTAAFAIPFADWIADPKESYPQALVLLPTRELALQVAAETARICAHTGLAVVPVYGGSPMGRQIEQLRAGAQVICGTPGRTLDHIRRGTFSSTASSARSSTSATKCFPWVSRRTSRTSSARRRRHAQTLLFSATIPEGIQRLARRFMHEPEKLKLSADFVGVHEIRHTYYSIPGGQREAELLRVLAFEEPERAVIFCNTRDETGRVAEYLRKQGMHAEPISSDLSQSEREDVMQRMRAGNIRFLVATDVAARGIDIENLPCVINYTFPESPELYIHRTGRTGRAGAIGARRFPSSDRPRSARSTTSSCSTRFDRKSARCHRKRRCARAARARNFPSCVPCCPEIQVRNGTRWRAGSWARSTRNVCSARSYAEPCPR
jgi:ATP-dependent RNA helicase DeaD